jgi:hypothetical protein
VGVLEICPGGVLLGRGRTVLTNTGVPVGVPGGVGVWVGIAVIVKMAEGVASVAVELVVGGTVGVVGVVDGGVAGGDAGTTSVAVPVGPAITVATGNGVLVAACRGLLAPDLARRAVCVGAGETLGGGAVGIRVATETIAVATRVDV